MFKCLNDRKFEISQACQFNVNVEWGEIMLTSNCLHMIEEFYGVWFE